MKHYAIRHKTGQIEVHVDSPLNGAGDTALCGHDLIGDSYLGWEAMGETDKKINCDACIKIIKFCHEVSTKEIGRPLTLND